MVEFPWRPAMKFGIIGLGRIGAGLARQALDKGHHVVGLNRSPDDTQELAKEGLDPAFSVDELVQKLDSPRLIFTYVPHGKATDQVLTNLGARLANDDVVIDGGNSHWKDSVRHHQELKDKGVWFLDVGTSGGVEGARRGACFMAGGDPEAFALAEPLLTALAVPEG